MSREEALRTVEQLPGMKEDELIALGACAVCRRKMFDAPDGNAILFYVVEISHLGWVHDALRRRVGLGMQIGSDAIARALGPNEDLAKIVTGPHRVAIHQGCADKIAHLAMLFPEEKPEDAESDNGSA